MSVPDAGGGPLDHARELADALVTAGGGSVEAVLLYGSHLLRASPDRHSAYDFVVVVEDYGRFYGSLKESGEIHRPAWLFSWTSRVLPPNVIAFTPDFGNAGMAKCLVVSHRHFQRALGPNPKDHFLLGRMVQRVAVVWSRGAEEGAWMQECLDGARRGILEWMGPYLDETFDAASTGQSLLEVCYRGEFRPEARNRSNTIFESQREHFVEVLTPVLSAAADAGVLARVTDDGHRDGLDGSRPDDESSVTYRLVALPSTGTRLRWRWHFFRSKVRVTARWVKHVLTFDNWLPYITRKVERRMGTKVELSPLERRFPLIFLWPRIIRTLRARPDREIKA